MRGEERKNLPLKELQESEVCKKARAAVKQGKLKWTEDRLRSLQQYKDLWVQYCDQPNSELLDRLFSYSFSFQTQDLYREVRDWYEEKKYPNGRDQSSYSHSEDIKREADVKEVISEFKILQEFIPAIKFIPKEEERVYDHHEENPEWRVDVKEFSFASQWSDIEIEKRFYLIRSFSTGGLEINWKTVNSRKPSCTDFSNADLTIGKELFATWPEPDSFEYESFIFFLIQEIEGKVDYKLKLFQPESTTRVLACHLPPNEVIKQLEAAYYILNFSPYRKGSKEMKILKNNLRRIKNGSLKVGSYMM